MEHEWQSDFREFLVNERGLWWRTSSTHGWSAAEADHTGALLAGLSEEILRLTKRVRDLEVVIAKRGRNIPLSAEIDREAFAAMDERWKLHAENRELGLITEISRLKGLLSAYETELGNAGLNARPEKIAWLSWHYREALARNIALEEENRRLREAPREYRPTGPFMSAMLRLDERLKLLGFDDPMPIGAIAESVWEAVQRELSHPTATSGPNTPEGE